MTTPVRLDAGRIFRLAPFDEVVAALRVTCAAGPAAVPRQTLRRADVPGRFLLLQDGDAVATLDGAALTALRTPAVSALATDALARDDVTRLAVFGTGVQAREHVRAMRWVRPSLERIEVVGRDPAGTDRFVAMLRGEGHPVVSASSAGASGADLICTCTSSSVPVLSDDAVKPGAHINAIGSHGPECRELGETLMGRARVVVDDRPAALAASGNLVLAIAAGTMTPADVAGELAAVARGEVRRETADEVTVFVSVGLAVADLAVATLAARNAGLID
jgi:ornithine cyclodeaminase/alanine dehydrogenase-like protein (mu-crystallin family)